MPSAPAGLPTVLGIVVARNEWPLVGAAIAHALTHHVDAVCVVDHASTDGTAEGLARLHQAWGERLRILRIDEDAFLQEAFNLAILEATRDLPHEWIYVFDADEFLLAPGSGGLRGYLAGMAADVDAVRYRFDHLIAPRDLDPSQVAGLVDIRFRARNLDDAVPPIEPLMEAIERGERTLFDVPFRSKLIARRRKGRWPLAGAHDWRSPDPLCEHPAAVVELRCAHLTYPSPARLRRKAEIGANKVRNGFSRLHGWQNQMVARIAEAGDLERFWLRHSLAPGAMPIVGDRTIISAEEDFPRAISTSLAALDAALRASPAQSGATPSSLHVSTLPTHALFSGLRIALERVATLEEEVAALEREVRKTRGGRVKADHGTAAAAPSADAWDHRRVAAMRRFLRPGIGLDRLFMNTRMLRDDLFAPCLAHLCDWSITEFGFHGDVRRQPRTVFVRTRFPFLETFFTEYLPRIEASNRFVFVTGSDDCTVPRQSDARYGTFENNQYQLWFDALRSDPRLIRWYADNVDTEGAGIVPIPCGTAGKYGCAGSIFIPRDRAPIRLRSRPLKALCNHRVREGTQWEKRCAVTRLAAGPWRDLVDVEDSIPCDRFAATLGRYPFTLCVTGGGLDPSPKAWVAMLAGSIPIIERSAMAPAYADFPVAWVDGWTADSISREKLETWVDALAPFYERPDERRRVLHQLSLGHWWRKIRTDAIAGRPAPPT